MQHNHTKIVCTPVYLLRLADGMRYAAKNGAFGLLRGAGVVMGRSPKEKAVAVKAFCCLSGALAA